MFHVGACLFSAWMPTIYEMDGRSIVRPLDRSGKYITAATM